MSDDVTRSAAPRDPVSGPAADDPSAAPAFVGRFVILGELARGGMGVVYRARDPDLNREVAVKVLADRLAGRPDAARRFLDEAKITGQLQHPNIPAVHEVGTLPDGRPFLAMKLIKGRTLDDHLEGPADRGALVADFEKVCEAVAYAHDRGVIHRDLKPSNVMVGSFGEVQVMDWGLAKLLTGDRSDPAPSVSSPEIRTTRDWDGSFTQAGAVMGTPAYMPPEQAGGETSRVDRRADVFGLGAVLCAILTGEPPYVGEGAEAVRLLAVRGRLDDAFARLDACGAEPEWVALAKRCLSTDRDARPADAGEVLATVTGLRAAAEERARRAELDRATAEVRAAEQRKRRRVQLSLGALAAVVAAAAVVGAVWWRSDRVARRDRARLVVETALGEAESGLIAERTAEVDVALARADQHLADLDAPDLRDRFTAAKSDRDMVVELNAILEAFWAKSAASFDRDGSGAGQRYAAAFRRYGRNPLQEPPAETADWLKRSRIADSLTDALNHWFFIHPETPGLRQLLAVADRDATRSGIRSAIAAKDDGKLRGLAYSDAAPALPTEFIVALGGHPALADDQAVLLMKGAWASRPGSYPLARQIGNRLFRSAADRDRREAVPWYRQAVALRPNYAPATKQLGFALATTGDAHGAVGFFRRALELEPDDHDALAGLVFALWRARDGEGAIAALRKLRRESRATDRRPSAVETEGFASGLLFGITDELISALFSTARPGLALELLRERLPPGGGGGAGKVGEELATGGRARYEAARAAALCAAGRGSDCPLPIERPTLRREARLWLATELEVWQKHYDADPVKRRARTHSTMSGWLTDPDLSFVRHPIAVGLLTLDEREAWQALWAEVRRLHDATVPELAPPPRPAK